MLTNTTQNLLSPAQLDELARELDNIKQDTLAKVGHKDAVYIRGIEKFSRYCAISGRALLMFGWFIPLWVIGTLLLAIAKIIENMELGHNVMHGQYNFMQDPRFRGSSYEWDIVGSADNWRKTHNYSHHTYTNVAGKDHDIGYSVLRLFKYQRWHIAQLFQPLYAIVFALLFQWGVAVQDMRLGRLLVKRITPKGLLEEQKHAFKKMGRQVFKDYVFFPALAGPFFLPVLLGNMAANTLRNLWTYLIIFCGHFTKDVYVFDKSVLENESRGHWYFRQILGSSNIKGRQWFHILSGNLSFQIEHHLFPDMPAYRYKEVAPKVEMICKRYGIPYNTGRLSKQFGQVMWRIGRYSLP
ncbi:acyl-CoA desaturase [Candidatus Sororendozoicomonas aggregata]|uniref:fatty acid desaturase family protein n=1 Tax=Candidatus Sororendozoicomonas aggregata TaxID=3073239 RepID=UPI002ED23DF5